MPQIGGKLQVTSLDKAESFYCDALGLALAGGDSRHILVKAGDGYLALSLQQGTPDSPANAGRASTGIVIVTPFHRRRLPHLQEAGAVVIEMSEPRWGGSETTIADPFGNVISLFSAGG